MAEPIHTFDCEEWCNHCTVCGGGTLYGSLCPDHWNKPDPLNPGQLMAWDGSPLVTGVK